MFRTNLFVLLNLPSAFLSGVRVQKVTAESVVVKVKYRWINKNPFKSMYWATQGMASELATGLLLLQEVSKSNKKIATLVTAQQGTFTKKAVGTIRFSCTDSAKVREVVKQAVLTGEGQTVTLVSEGLDASNAIVSRFEYQWSLKLKP